MNDAVKTIRTETAIDQQVTTPSPESSTEQEQPQDFSTNDAAVEPSSLNYEDVAQYDLTWDEEPTQTDPNQPQETEPQEEPEEVAKQPEDMTESMSKRISNIKSKHADELEVRDNKIQEYQEMLTRFQDIEQQEKAVNSVEGDEENIRTEIANLERRLEEEEDELTPAASAKIVRDIASRERQIDKLHQANEMKGRINTERNSLRQASDNLANESFSFLLDKESNGYKMAREQVYPTLERLLPNFKDNPQDVFLTGYLTDLMLAKQENTELKNQILKMKGGSPRSEPPSLAEESVAGTTPKNNPNPNPNVNRADLMQKVRNGEMEGGLAAQLLGAVSGGY